MPALASGVVCSRFGAVPRMLRPRARAPSASETAPDAQRPRALAWRQARLRPPFAQESGTMCRLGKGAVRRLGLALILAPARIWANPPDVSPASRVRRRPFVPDALTGDAGDLPGHPRPPQEIGTLYALCRQRADGQSKRAPIRDLPGPHLSRLPIKHHPVGNAPGHVQRNQGDHQPPKRRCVNLERQETQGNRCQHNPLYEE
jgi:hypothetical protein